MTSDAREIRIAIDMPDRRGLIARFCAELGRALAPGEQWARDDIVVPWHASAETFEALPDHLLTAVLGEWDEVGDQLSDLEFSGYLEGERGPRAWGCIHLHPGQPRAFRPEVGALTLGKIDAGYRLEVRLVPGEAGTDGVDA